MMLVEKVDSPYRRNLWGRRRDADQRHRTLNFRCQRSLELHRFRDSRVVGPKANVMDRRRRRTRIGLDLVDTSGVAGESDALDGGLGAGR